MSNRPKTDFVCSAALPPLPNDALLRLTVVLANQLALIDTPIAKICRMAGRGGLWGWYACSDDRLEIKSKRSGLLSAVVEPLTRSSPQPVRTQVHHS